MLIGTGEGFIVPTVATKRLVYSSVKDIRFFRAH